MWTRLRCSVVAWLSPLLLHSFAPLLLGSFPEEIPAFDKVIDSPMYKAPDTPGPRTDFVFPEKAKDLWVKVLERPDAEMRCRAAEAIVRAHGRGVKGLETTIAPLRAVLDQPDQHPAVRLAVARALIVLEAQDSARSLFRLARSGGVELRNVIEPALARWNYRPAREVWH